MASDQKGNTVRSKCPTSVTCDVVRSALRYCKAAGRSMKTSRGSRLRKTRTSLFLRVGGSDVASSRSALARYKVLLHHLVLAAPHGIVHKLRVREGLRKFSKHDMNNLLAKPCGRVGIEGYNIVYMKNV